MRVVGQVAMAQCPRAHVRIDVRSYAHKTDLKQYSMYVHVLHSYKMRSFKASRCIENE